MSNQPPEPQYRVDPQYSPQPQYGYQPSYQPQPMGGVKPSNNLAWALVCLFLFCQLFGIVSLVYSLQVDGKWTSGDRMGAQDYADKAKKWAIIGMVGGALVMVAYVVLLMAGVATGAFVEQ